MARIWSRKRTPPNGSGERYALDLRFPMGAAASTSGFRLTGLSSEQRRKFGEW
jgi:hypothetical protein